MAIREKIDLEYKNSLKSKDKIKSIIYDEELDSVVVKTNNKTNYEKKLKINFIEFRKISKISINNFYYNTYLTFLFVWRKTNIYYHQI